MALFGYLVKLLTAFFMHMQVFLSYVALLTFFSFSFRALIRPGFSQPLYGVQVEYQGTSQVLEVWGVISLSP